MKNKVSNFAKFAIVLSILLILGSFAIPQYIRIPLYPPRERVICSEEGVQQHPKVISSGNYYTIIAWEDKRDGTVDIYAQRVSRRGGIRWERNGIKVCSTNNEGFCAYYKIISDGNKGTIIVWQDERNGNTDIYAQKIDRRGSLEWGEDGVAVCVAEGNQDSPQLISDGAGGAVIAWGDQRNENDSARDIYAQRLDTNGNTLWAENGIPICTEFDDQRVPELIRSDNNDFIIAWSDDRYNGGWDIYVQKIDADGSIMWQEDGVLVSESDGNLLWPKFLSDNNGGVIIVWWDNEFDEDTGNIFAQRINENGEMMWGINGEVVSEANRGQEWQQIIASDDYSAIIVWFDHRDGVDSDESWELYASTFDIYAQKIDFDGNIIWDLDGIPVCTAEEYQSPPQIVTDGSGGAIITWHDNRNGGEGTSDIYVQRISPDGIPLWRDNGKSLCRAEGAQLSPTIVSRRRGRAIITWQDNRNGEGDIYAQGVKRNGRKLWRARRPIRWRIPTQ